MGIMVKASTYCEPPVCQIMTLLDHFRLIPKIKRLNLIGTKACSGDSIVSNLLE